MRLWTIHPSYLDAKGLVAAWRESLLAQKVLLGQTKGYTRHPQLTRFRESPDPSGAIAAYLAAIYDEACRRGYHFDKSKIAAHRFTGRIEETGGQLMYEWEHLLKKLALRAPEVHGKHLTVSTPIHHPLFHIVPGPVRDWERTDENPMKKNRR